MRYVDAIFMGEKGVMQFTMRLPSLLQVAVVCQIQHHVASQNDFRMVWQIVKWCVD